MKNHPEYLLAFFAHPYDTPPETRPTLVATDKAGNTREMRLAFELKNVRYRKSTLAISDSFLQNKVAPLLTDVAARARAERRLRRRQPAAAKGKRGPNRRDHQEGHALDPVEGRLRPAQQLEGRGELLQTSGRTPTTAHRSIPRTTLATTSR